MYWETENCVGWRGGIVLDVLAGCPFISCVKQLGLFVVVYNLLVGNGWEILPLEGSLSLSHSLWDNIGFRVALGLEEITKPNQNIRMWLHAHCRHHSDGVYMHQETDGKNSGGAIYLLFFFNVTGGKGERKKRCDGHLNDGHPHVLCVCSPPGLYNVWLCYWFRVLTISLAFCHLRQYCRFNGRAMVVYWFFVFYFFLLAKAKPISHCPLLTEGNRQSKEAHWFFGVF